MKNSIALFVFYSSVLTAMGVTVSEKNYTIDDNHVNQNTCVYNGRPVSTDELPYIVNLESGNYKNYFCAGALIDLNMVVTTADCIHNKISGFGGTIPVKSVQVHAGDQLIDVPEGEEQVLNAAKVIMHPDFKPLELLNDIALIELEKAFTQTVYVQPIQLPSKNRAITGGTGKTAGWILDASKTLKVVGLPVMAGPVCAPELTDESGGQFCAGGRSVNSCQGVKGSPFVCTGADNELCGLVSFNKGCDCRTIIPPGVYTNIYHHKSWIEANRKSGSTSAGNFPTSSLLVVLPCIGALFFGQ